MKIAFSVKSHNPMANMRMNLLESCLHSAQQAFGSCDRFLFLNGVDDGSQEAQTELAKAFGFQVISLSPPDGNYTPGSGAKVAGNVLSFRYTAVDDIGVRPYDVVVLSDDDMVWHPQSAAVIEHVMPRKPFQVKLISGLLEPEWKWNTPRRTVACGRYNILVRDSCPGAAWIFQAEDWVDIGPHVERAFGYDYDACCALVKNGFEVAQIDLAEHAGWGSSTHGNEAIHTGKPLDRDRWGV